MRATRALSELRTRKKSGMQVSAEQRLLKPRTANAAAGV
jgi:hypothetical protein